MNKQIRNKFAGEWINRMIELTNPAKVVLIDGSEEQKKKITAEAVEAGELITLNQNLMPGCYLRRSNPNDVARVEERTFICTDEQKEAGPTNNWAYAPEMYDKMHILFKDSMKGKTMYIIPYLMGPYDSEFSKVGFELTDSRYVVLSMLIMARCGQRVLDELGSSNEFVKGLHSVGRFDFPQEASGILACLRFGPESLFDEDERRLLMRRLGAVAETERSDTNFTMKSHALRRNREKIVLDMIEQFSKYKVIVTDRYHGMIFSLAANRPVVVLPTFGHKITSGIDWFPADYKEYIYVAEDMHDVEAIIRKVEQAYSLPLSGRLPSYFKERYYDRLKEQIG